MDLTESLLKPDPNSVNIGFKSPTVKIITSLPGNPRNDYRGDSSPSPM
jgi:hypothetical protein